MVFKFLKTTENSYLLFAFNGKCVKLEISENKHEIIFGVENINSALNIIYSDLNSIAIIDKKYKSINGALTAFNKKYKKYLIL